MTYYTYLDIFGYIRGTKWHELSLNISYFDVQNPGVPGF